TEVLRIVFPKMAADVKETGNVKKAGGWAQAQRCPTPARQASLSYARSAHPPWLQLCVSEPRPSGSGNKRPSSRQPDRLLKRAAQIFSRIPLRCSRATTLNHSSSLRSLPTLALSQNRTLS